MTVLLGPPGQPARSGASLGAVRKGVGRFDTRIDQAAYKLALKGVHEEWGHPDGPQGYLGYYRGGQDKVDELVGKEGDLNRDEREFLKPIVAFIVHDDRLGSIWVDYYADEKESEAAWDMIVRLASEQGGVPAGIRMEPPGSGAQYILDRLVAEAAQSSPPDDEVGDPFLDFGQWGIIRSAPALRVSEAAERTGLGLTGREREILDRTAGIIYRNQGSWFAVWYIDDREELEKRWARVLEDWDKYRYQTGVEPGYEPRSVGKEPWQIKPEQAKVDASGKAWPPVHDRLANPDDYAEPGSYFHNSITEGIERLQRAFSETYGAPTREMRDYYDVPAAKEHLKEFPYSVVEDVDTLEKLVRGTWMEPQEWEEIVLSRYPDPEDFHVYPASRQGADFKARVKKLKDAFKSAFGKSSAYAAYYEVPEAREYLSEKPQTFLSDPMTNKLVAVIKGAAKA